AMPHLAEWSHPRGVVGRAQRLHPRPVVVLQKMCLAAELDQGLAEQHRPDQHGCTCIGLELLDPGQAQHVVKEARRVATKQRIPLRGIAQQGVEHTRPPRPRIAPPAAPAPPLRGDVAELMSQHGGELQRRQAVHQRQADQ
ncbi:hypothetical protein RZS08_24815, partial [Arthrospira platensis SPKY1]|nr:hypothetical protein [Arthrospira platensis SPKY1]